MGSADIKGLRFADAQELRFLAWKRLYMVSAFLLGFRFADVQELLFQTSKPSCMDYAELQMVYLLIVRSGVFRPRNFQK